MVYKITLRHLVVTTCFCKIFDVIFNRARLINPTLIRLLSVVPKGLLSIPVHISTVCT